MYLFLTAADSTGAAGGGASMILMFVVLIAVFYFFMIRPENKRKKEAQQMRDSLKVGDNITTIGGIIGDIVSIKDNSIVKRPPTASALSLQSLQFPPTTRRKRKLPSRRPQLWLPARSRRKKRRRTRRINNCLTPYKAAKMKCPQKVRQNYEHNLFKQPKGPAACGSQTAGPSALP